MTQSSEQGEGPGEEVRGREAKAWKAPMDFDFYSEGSETPLERLKQISCELEVHMREREEPGMLQTHTQLVWLPSNLLPLDLKQALPTYLDEASLLILTLKPQLSRVLSKDF